MQWTLASICGSVYVYDAEQNTFARLPRLPASTPVTVHNAKLALQCIDQGEYFSGCLHDAQTEHTSVMTKVQQLAQHIDTYLSLQHSIQSKTADPLCHKDTVATGSARVVGMVLQHSHTSRNVATVPTEASNAHTVALQCC